MKIRLAIRRGTVLLQTLIISMLLAYIAISVTRWVLQRYMGAVRLQKSTTGRIIETGGAMRAISGWAGGNPTGSHLYVGGKRVNYQQSGNTLTFTYEDEQ